ncbi:lytic murein transglycosylase [Faunimonas sp. B44]|uniref:lytic murein transglycosylase n=1 Tax=Faunimonas sp. B44 TaxID=3461493 RepID=UPI004044D65D
MASIRHIGLLAAALLILAVAMTARAQADEGFRRWVSEFRAVAQAEGIAPAVFDAAFADVVPDPEVLEKARHQPEFVKPIWDYLAHAASDMRVRNGREMLERHRDVLGAIEAEYAVDRHVLVAIWGIESSYGEALSNPRIVKPIIRSLATLAHGDPRRAQFARNQLIAALTILQRGDVSAAELTGSWAGAMGHTQFIPTTFEDHAVDFDGDGARNVWHSPADALASAANYLKASGWVSGRPWGQEAILPEDFDFHLADQSTERSIAEWRRHGVRHADEGAAPRPEETAILVLPVGAKGPAFLMLRNHYVIRRYNKALAYALAVGHLADRLGGGGPFVQSWPVTELPLAGTDREELQKLLAEAGYYDGPIDGLIGPRSIAAIRAYQSEAGLTPDGHAGAVLLEALRGS